MFLVSILLTTLPASAQNRSAPEHTPVAAQRVQRDFLLEQAVFDRSNRLKAQLQPSAKARLDRITTKIVRRMASDTKNVEIVSHARREIRRQFPIASNEQIALLNFYVLSEIAKAIIFKQEVFSLSLQMWMDRRSHFMTALSNISRKTHSTSIAIIRKLK